MKSNFLLVLPVFGCLALASCYPIPDDPSGSRGPRPKKDGQSITSQEQQEIQKKRDEMKKRDEEKREELTNKKEERPPAPDRPSPKPTEPKTGDYVFASPVPGKEGFVFSPYNQKVIDVRGMPTGQLVMDPTYKVEEKKYFRVP